VSINRLWNHSVRLYRLPAIPESRGTLGSTSKSPVPVTALTTQFNARPHQDWGGDLTDRGPGEQQGTKRRWFLEKSIDVRERDILSVTSGPETGLRLSVESIAKPGRVQGVHHIEVMGSVWKGVLGE
jgi:hypothetical protein